MSDGVTSARGTTLTSAICAGLLLGVVVIVDGARRETAAPATHLATTDGSDEPAGGGDAVVVTSRPVRERAPRAVQRLARARAIGAQGSLVVNPCLATTTGVCERTALEPFFRDLDALDQGRAARHATVAVLGNSLIAADHIVDVVRERLTERFGAGGRGFVLADRIAEYGGRARTGKASGRWRAHNFSMGERGRFPFGVAGVLHVSQSRGARTSWTLAGERKARLFVYEHERSPALRVLVDERPSMEAVASHGDARVLEVTLPEGARTLTLESGGRGAVVYGALLERDTPGVVVNSFGVPAADARHFLATDPAIFAAQLTAQDPSLVVVLLGGNETKRLHWGRRRRAEVERDYAALLDRLRATVPRAACLAVGPIDSVYGGPEKVWRTRSHLGWVIAMQKRVAAERGCAYFDLFEAMGGAGSLRRFASRGLLHDDMVHPKQAGLDLLGELLADALLGAYERTPIVERADQIAAPERQGILGAKTEQTP